MAFTMRELKNAYFDFLPGLASGSLKSDTEPLQHAIFTYGDLRKVLEAQRRIETLLKDGLPEVKP